MTKLNSLSVLVMLSIFIFLVGCQKKNYVKYYQVAETPSSFSEKDSLLNYYFKMTLVNDTVEFFVFTERGQSEIMYYDLNKPVLGNDRIPYWYKMFLIPELDIKRDTSNQGMNKKETFSYTRKKNIMRYSSSMKRLTDPQLAGEIFMSKDSTSLLRSNTYPGYPKTIKYLQTVNLASEDQIKYIEEELRKFLIEYEKL